MQYQQTSSSEQLSINDYVHMHTNIPLLFPNTTIFQIIFWFWYSELGLILNVAFSN